MLLRMRLHTVSGVIGRRFSRQKKFAKNCIKYLSKKTKKGLDFFNKLRENRRRDKWLRGFRTGRPRDIVSNADLGHSVPVVLRNYFDS